METRKKSANDEKFGANKHKAHHEYSQFYVFVCNIPDESYLKPSQKSIISGLTNKWKKKQNDPNGHRLHIIYLRPGEDVTNAKFAPLAKCDNRSKIYIIGHCYPGSKCISSDPVYDKEVTEHEKNESDELISGAKAKERRHFDVSYIAQILIANITNPEIILARNDMTSFNSVGRRLRICIPSCFSGVDKLNHNPNNNNDDDKLLEKSFGARLFDYLMNEMTKLVLKCDIVANKGYVMPIPTQANIFSPMAFIDLIKTIFNIEIEASDFHKRHICIEDNALYSIFPRYQPEGMDYKITMMMPLDVSAENVDKSDIQAIVLSTKESEVWLNIQMKAESISNLCAELERQSGGERDDELNYIIAAKTALLKGTNHLNLEERLKSLSILEEKLETRLNQILENDIDSAKSNKR